MGTNFYCRHIPTEKEHQTLQELLASKKYKELKETLEELTQPYHIGKRSYGWQFLFQANDEKEHPTQRSEWDPKCLVPWDTNLQSIKDYLKQDNLIIYNEYGEEFSFDNFWDKEVGKSLYNDEDRYMNLEQYYKKTPGEYHSRNTEILKDGLRFETVQFS